LWNICITNDYVGTNKADRHDITEKLLKVALNTITLTLTPYAPNYSVHSYATDYGYNVHVWSSTPCQEF
jgi:hypothetical protein